MKQRIYTLTLLLMAFALGAMAQLRLPAIISDHMVIQRGEPVHVWGWAAQGQKVTATLAGHKATVRTGKDGRWSLYLPAISAAGPHSLRVSAGKESLSVTDILAGEVWMTSGQSNMDFRLRSIDRADDEISHATNASIRLFEINHALASRPADDVSGHWAVTTPEAADCFTAVGYLFARELAKRLNCAVGIINTSWGGTDIETWMSPKAIESFPKYNPLVEEMRTADLDAQAKRWQVLKAKFDKAVREECGERDGWYRTDFDKSDWQRLEVPGLWTIDTLAKMDGVVWTTTQFDVPEELTGKEATLYMGMIDDDDVTWVNGQRIGETKGFTVKRTYTIPAGVLKAGKNELTVKIIDDHGGGGCYGPRYLYFIRVGSQRIPILKHPWKYRISAVKDLEGFVPDNPNKYPSRLYNAMVAPICRYGIKGVIWYQGENNANRAQEYYRLFPAMISDWREQWKRPEMPFYWVQLANFMKPVDTPAESSWATLRDAQNATLSLPHTGQAVIIDVGEADDVHPKDKQTVANRLSLMALNHEYGMHDVYCDSPQPVRAERTADGNILLTLRNEAETLVCHDRYGYACGFAVAGADGVYRWAKGEGVAPNQGRLTTPKGVVPMMVRYAWGDNPDDANLYNSAGLPTTPFQIKVEPAKP